MNKWHECTGKMVQTNFKKQTELVNNNFEEKGCVNVRQKLATSNRDLLPV